LEFDVVGDGLVGQFGLRIEVLGHKQTYLLNSENPAPEKSGTGNRVFAKVI
jgi:hypothetical protein